MPFDPCVILAAPLAVVLSVDLALAGVPAATAAVVALAVVTARGVELVAGVETATGDEMGEALLLLVSMVEERGEAAARGVVVT